MGIPDKEREGLDFLLYCLVSPGGLVAQFVGDSSGIAAYLDESMTAETKPITAVAGYVFEPQNYTKFNDNLRDLLWEYKLRYFRASECFSEGGEFAQHRATDVPRKVETAMIRLIRDYAVLGVGAGVSDAALELLQPRFAETCETSNSYNLLCQWCMNEIASWADSKGYHGKVAYFFEAGCKHQSVVNQVLGRIADSPSHMAKYRYGSHAFALKTDPLMGGLQAGDLLAWFIRRECEDADKLNTGRVARDRRRDFQALIGETIADLKVIVHKYKFFDYSVLSQHFKNECETAGIEAALWY